MTISVGMLLFCIIDSIVAFFLVYHVTKAKIRKKNIAQIISAILDILVASAFFAVTIWFNTSPYTISKEAQYVVYLAPIVLSILMIILVLLSAPPKKEEDSKPGNASDSESDSVSQ